MLQCNDVGLSFWIDIPGPGDCPLDKEFYIGFTGGGTFQPDNELLFVLGKNQVPILKSVSFTEIGRSVTTGQSYGGTSCEVVDGSSIKFVVKAGKKVSSEPFNFFQELLQSNSITSFAFLTEDKQGCVCFPAGSDCNCLPSEMNFVIALDLTISTLDGKTYAINNFNIAQTFIDELGNVWAIGQSPDCTLDNNSLKRFAEYPGQPQCNSVGLSFSLLPDDQRKFLQYSLFALEFTNQGTTTDKALDLLSFFQEEETPIPTLQSCPLMSEPCKAGKKNKDDKYPVCLEKTGGDKSDRRLKKKKIDKRSKSSSSDNKDDSNSSRDNGKSSFKNVCATIEKVEKMIEDGKYSFVGCGCCEDDNSEKFCSNNNDNIRKRRGLRTSGGLRWN